NRSGGIDGRPVFEYIRSNVRFIRRKASSVIFLISRRGWSAGICSSTFSRQSMEACLGWRPRMLSIDHVGRSLSRSRPDFSDGLLVNWLEVGLHRAAVGTHPIVGQALEWSARRDAAVGI